MYFEIHTINDTSFASLARFHMGPVNVDCYSAVGRYE
jgi:hypothetical protein